MGDRHALHENSSDDAVAVELDARQAVHERRGLCVGLLIPYDTTAERDRAGEMIYRVYRQDQLIDTVLIGYRAVTVVIMDRLTDTQAVQTRATAPVKRLVLADRNCLDIMEFRFIFGQDQTIDVITSRCRVMAGVLVHACGKDRIRLSLAVQDVLPIVRMGAVQHTGLQVQLTRMLHDRDPVSRVAGIDIVVLAGIDIGLAVETHRLLVAQREGRVDIHQFLHRQVQTVVLDIAVRTMTREEVIAALTLRHTMPRERGIRTDGHHGVNCIYLICS